MRWASLKAGMTIETVGRSFTTPDMVLVLSEVSDIAIRGRIVSFEFMENMMPKSVATSVSAVRWHDAALIAGGSLVVALSAQIAIPLPWTPVPVTLQPLAVMLVGAFLGPWRGAASMFLYLIEGAAGLPVFTPIGTPGIAHLLGPYGAYHYLIGSS